MREFEQTGLQNIVHPPPAPAAREETLPAPSPPMQTRSARKQFKPEVRSKRNEDRHKQSGQTSEDSGMDPLGSVEIPSEGEENIAPRRPAYVPPLRPGVKPPRRNKQFTISTPSLPPGVQLVGTMTGKIDRLKYSNHDTSDRDRFP